MSEALAKNHEKGSKTTTKAKGNPRKLALEATFPSGKA